MKKVNRKQFDVEGKELSLSTYDGAYRAVSELGLKRANDIKESFKDGFEKFEVVQDMLRAKVSSKVRSQVEVLDLDTAMEIIDLAIGDFKKDKGNDPW